MNRAVAHIATNIGFTLELLAEIHEFVRSEMIVLCHASPVSVYHARTIFVRADTISPMILVRETARW
jgi:hypothetical protein